MKVKIIKFHPLVSHDVDEIVEFEDAFAKKHIEAGFAEAAKGGKSAKKNEDGSDVVNENNDITDINEAEDHLSDENHGALKNEEAQDSDGNVIETKLVTGAPSEAKSSLSEEFAPKSVNKTADKKTEDVKPAK